MATDETGLAPVDPPSAADASARAAAVRRRMWIDGLGIGLASAAFGLVYGLAARQAGFSLVEGTAMSNVLTNAWSMPCDVSTCW